MDDFDTPFYLFILCLPFLSIDISPVCGLMDVHSAFPAMPIADSAT